MERLSALVEQVRGALQELLDQSAIVYDDPNASGGPLLFIGWSKYRWEPLPEAAQATAHAARAALERLQAFASRVIHGTPGDGIGDLGVVLSDLAEVIDQRETIGGPPGKTIDEVRSRVEERCARIVATVDRLPPPADPPSS